MVSTELLRRYPYFAPVSEESLRQLAMIAEERVVPAGETMFLEQSPASRLYIIVRGEVAIQYTLGSGQRRTVDRLVDGDLLVWSALVPPYRTTCAGIVEKETHLIGFEAARVRELCERDPLLGYRLMTQVVMLLGHRLTGALVQLAAV